MSGYFQIFQDMHDILQALNYINHTCLLEFVCCQLVEERQHAAMAEVESDKRTSHLVLVDHPDFIQQVQQAHLVWL